MTGEKDRFKTLERLGKFEDESLKTPEHDEMVLQLREPRFLLEHIELLREVLKDDRIELTEGDPFYSVFTPSMEAKLSSGVELSEDESNIISKRFERLKIGKDVADSIWKAYVFGYKQLALKPHEEYVEEILRNGIRCEVPIKSSPTFIVGYWDMVVSIEPIIQRYSRNYSLVGEPPQPEENCLLMRLERIVVPRKTKLCFEVKPSIPSFGTVLRQINTYKEFERGSPRVYLYTRDSRFDSAFEAEGIRVIHSSKPNGGG